MLWNLLRKNEYSSKINSILLFGEHSIKTPVFVLKHPLEEMDKEERIKILRFPSILGRDICNSSATKSPRHKEVI